MYLDERSPHGNPTLRRVEGDLCVCLSPLPSPGNSSARQSLAGEIAGLELPPNNDRRGRAIPARALSPIPCERISLQPVGISGERGGRVGCAAPALTSVSSYHRR